MDSAVLGVQLALAVVFATAGVAKLFDMRGTRAALAGFGLPAGPASVAGPLLPLAELAVAAALIPASTARWGAVGAVALLLAFAAGIANAMRKGRAPDCHCFGQLHSAPAGGATLGRNLVLAALAGFVVVQGPGPEVGDWVAARSAAELVAIGTTAAALTLAAVSLRLRSQNRALRHALVHAQAPAEPEPEGLPVGAPAPDFELPNLQGEMRSLESLRAGGRSVLLVFFDPHCGPCFGLLPHLPRWQAALTEKVAVAVVSGGTLEANRTVWEGRDTEVLLEGESEDLSKAYRVLAWPQAIAIDADGRIAYEPALSLDAMEVLIRVMLEAPVTPPRQALATVTVPATAGTDG